jgi:hypothetical protein
MRYVNMQLGKFFKNRSDDSIDRIVSVVDSFELVKDKYQRSTSEADPDDLRVEWVRVAMLYPIGGLPKQVLLGRLQLDPGLVVRVPSALKPSQNLLLPVGLCQLSSMPTVYVVEQDGHKQ